MTLPYSTLRYTFPHPDRPSHRTLIPPMLLDHLYATPYITTAGDRTSDLLGWRRMRTAWQRRLFPMFTVLTWSRDFAEISLAMRVAACDCGNRADLWCSATWRCFSV